VAAYIPAMGHTGITTLPDLSPSKRHASFSSGASAPTWVIGGNPRLPGYALDYDGADTDLFEITDPPIVQAVPLTIVAVARSTNNSSIGSIIDYGGNAPASFSLVQVNADVWAFAEQDATSDHADATVVAGTWQHYVGVQTRNNLREMYLDGVLVDTNITEVNVVAVNIDRMRIGQRADDATDQNFDGQIALCLVYNRALTPNEIQTLYVYPLAPFRLRRRIIAFDRLLSFPAAAEPVQVTGGFRRISPPVRPSYQQGYARSAVESAHPEFWKGLVGAWVPALGPTGLTLRDVSAYENHGTLTNMDPATDWNITGKSRLPGYGLNFAEGSSNLVDLLGTANSTVIGPPGSFSIVAWVTHASTTDANTIIGNRVLGSLGTDTGFYLSTSTNAIDDEIEFLVEDNDSDYQVRGWAGLISVGNLTMWCAVLDLAVSGVEPKMYFNGVDQGNGINRGATTTVDGGILSDSDLRIGNRPATTARAFDGDIHGIMLFHRALRPAEVQFLYQNPLAPFQLRSNLIPVKAEVAAVVPTQVTGAFRRIIPDVVPSYQTGIARNASESAYPSLWRGLYAAWEFGFAPVIGGSGDGVRDWGSYGMHLSDDGANGGPNPLEGDDWGITGDPRHPGWAPGLDRVTANSGEYYESFLSTDTSGHAMRPTTSMAIAVSFRNSSYTASNRMLIGKGVNNLTWQVYRLRIDTATGKVDMGIHDRVAGEFPSWLSTKTVSNDTWHHVVINVLRISDPSAVSDVEIWFDGINDTVTGGTGGTFTSFNYEDETLGETGDSIRIGAGHSGQAALSVFGGEISYCYIWNRALTPNEVRTLYDVPYSLLRPRSNLIPVKGEVELVQPKIGAFRRTIPKAARPSYQQGYARSAGESAYPGFWKGLIGAWGAALGVTGDAALATVRDWSGWDNHGTTTSDPIIVAIGGNPRLPGYAQRFASASATQFNVGTIASGDDLMLDSVKLATIVTVAKRLSTGDSFGRLVSKASAADGADGYEFSVHTNGDTHIHIDGNFYGPASSSTGVWAQRVAIFGGAGSEIWINGKLEVSTTTVAIPDSAQILYFGAATGWSAFRSFEGDISLILIYDRPLNANEIVFLYNTPLAPFILHSDLVGGLREAAVGDVTRTPDIGSAILTGVPGFMDFGVIVPTEL